MSPEMQTRAKVGILSAAAAAIITAAILKAAEPPPIAYGDGTVTPSWAAGSQSLWLSWPPRETNITYILWHKTSATGSWAEYTRIVRPRIHYFVNVTNAEEYFKVEAITE